jgi:putative transposase
MRAAHGLPSLRTAIPFNALRDALAASSGASFRVLHFSVQADHLHLVLEADEPTGLSRGVQGLAIRAARAVNRALRRHGRVWADRFHARALATPREVRNALVYVLNNLKNHVPGTRGIDPRSSGAWFTGWKQAMPVSPIPLAGGASAHVARECRVVAARAHRARGDAAASARYTAPLRRAEDVSAAID